MIQLIYILNYMEHPIILKLNNGNNTLSTTSQFMDYHPLFEFGFNQRVFSANNLFLTSFVNKFAGKKKVYMVFHKYDYEIDNYENNLKKIVGKSDENYYIIYELMHFFDNLQDKLTFTFIGENTNEHKNAVQDYRKNKNDTFINKFSETDFFILNSDVSPTELNLKENNAFEFIFDNVIKGLKILKRKGNMIIKIYDTYTLKTISLITFLTTLFDEVFIVKPLASNLIDVDKYVICKYYNNKFDNYKNYELSPNLKIQFRTFNTLVGNLQYKTFNDAYNYIASEIYFGDVYNEKNKEQIEGTLLWLKTYWHKNNFPQMLEKSLNFMNEKIKEMENKIIFY